jgi:cytochrome c-type protein NapC
MNDPNVKAPGKGIVGFIKRWLAFVASPSTRLSLGVLFIAGVVSGIIFWGGFNWALEGTNNMEFCISSRQFISKIEPA